MLWSVYADLSRALTNEEREAVGTALEVLVPGSGCVGAQTGTIEEVYFRLEAPLAEEAKAEAARRVKMILHTAGVRVEYQIDVQRCPTG
jgi:hypothetical protein